jgi:hypothetical protein
MLDRHNPVTTAVDIVKRHGLTLKTWTSRKISALTVLGRYHVTHIALFIAYIVTGVVLAREGAFAHMMCVLAIAAIYAASCGRPPKDNE